MRGILGEPETLKQFGIGLGVMLPWPVGAALLQSLDGPIDYLIYLVGMFWNLLWDPVARLQGALSPTGVTVATTLIVGMLILMWLTIAVLPLLGRWPRREVIGLWAIQCGYAGAQAISGYFYARSFLA